jgi:hypothetical protein
MKKKANTYYYYHFVISPDDQLQSFTRTLTDQKLDPIKTLDNGGRRMIGVFIAEEEDRNFMAKINEFIAAL